MSFCPVMFGLDSGGRDLVGRIFRRMLSYATGRFPRRSRSAYPSFAVPVPYLLTATQVSLETVA